jgi:hypothetical protein
VGKTGRLKEGTKLHINVSSESDFKTEGSRSPKKG